MTKKILIAASGTGGHVIPALNIAEKLLDINYKITWVGTKKGIENKLVNNKVDIKFKEGFLNIEIDKSNNIFMTGPVSEIKNIKVEI